MVEKDKKIFLGIILILLLFMLFVSIMAFQDKKKDKNIVNINDAILFKQEYEYYNGKVFDDNGEALQKLSISQKNPIDKLTEEEAVSLLEHGTGILYLGFPTSPLCRSMLPTLFQTLDNMNITNLSYLNIFDIQDTYSLDEKNKPVKNKEGTESYYKILDILDEYLDDYTLKTESGKTVSTQEKRIDVPLVVGIKEGKIVGVHSKTVKSHTNPYEDLSKEQEEELAQIYVDLINQVYDVNCDEKC